MTAQELSERAELSEELRQLAAPTAHPRDYVEQLARAEKLREAVSVLAHAFVRRDAIAWALESVRGVEAAMARPHAAKASQAVGDWLAEPNDERRRAAMDAARQADVGTPAGCLALAVFFSGGSMAPASAPVNVEPPPNVCAKMAGAAMLMAAVIEPQHTGARLRAFLDRGLQRARELKIWEEK